MLIDMYRNIIAAHFIIVKKKKTKQLEATQISIDRKMVMHYSREN